MRISAGLLLVLLSSACGVVDDDEEQQSAAPQSAQIAIDPSVYGDPRQRLTPEELERGRFDTGWRRFVQLDSLPGGEVAESSESWEQITAESLNSAPTALPIQGDVAGPTVTRVQIALDRALFSPGVIDGRWGMNTEKAVYWLQAREGLPATGRVDSATFARLVQLAGVQQFAQPYRLTAEDVQGPFVEVPEDIYEKAELDCMCYESLSEKLAERFHSTPELLAKLNPGVSIDSAQAGQTLNVPHVRGEGGVSLGSVADIVISDGGYYVHAVDASGRILAHFPTTLGSEYAPSPQGHFTITGIAEDPTWHYQPELLTGVDDSEEEAIIPPGPNNAVGVVWMQLSEPHYGIHGTSAPETIGYVTSHGCVRLTNWDARFLSQQIQPGVRVEFRDIT